MGQPSLANILPGGGGWRKKSAQLAKPIFLSSAAASQSKKLSSAPKRGGLGVYRKMTDPRKQNLPAH